MRVRVTNRNGKRIRSVIRVGRIRDLQKRADHLKNLRFFRPPVSRNGTFDLRRRVLINGKVRCSCGVDADTPRVSKFESALDICRMKDAFKNCLVRSQLLNNLHQPAVDCLQSQ